MKKLLISDWSKEQKDFIHTLNLITIKPVLYVCNVDESSIAIMVINFLNRLSERAKKEMSSMCNCICCNRITNYRI